jgi:hypothetical protein
MISQTIVNSRVETYTIPPVWCRIRRLMMLLGPYLRPRIFLKLILGSTRVSKSNLIGIEITQ